MSYGMAAALQQAVFARLSADVALQAVVGGDVYDSLPTGTLPTTYVLLGEEDARTRGDVTARGAEHEFMVGVFSDAAGFAIAKQAAVAVSDALVDAPLSLARGRLVSLDFLRARARRGRAPGARRIELWFRARLDDV
ncbi:MAG: DUF3168 domain-containing protein [Paracoccaceae bacterium]|nr:DUF3168 domain-containing protein [Paracoccaceae bacterium]